MADLLPLILNFLSGLSLGIIMTGILCASLSQRAQNALALQLVSRERLLDEKDAEIVRLRSIPPGTHPVMAHALANAPALFATARLQARLLNPSGANSVDQEMPEAEGASQVAPVRSEAEALWDLCGRSTGPRDHLSHGSE